MNAQPELALGPAPDRRKTPPEPIARAAEIDGPYRWTLRRSWGAGPCVMWCGLNPSTADGKRDDPTMLRVIGFSYRWGFGSLVMVNVYPFISSTTDVLHGWRNGWDDREAKESGYCYDIVPCSVNAQIENARRVTEEVGKCSAHVAAWGNGIEREDDVKEFLARVGLKVEDDEVGDVVVPIEWKCLGVNANGSPKHPLSRGRGRIPDDAKLMTWRLP